MTDETAVYDKNYPSRRLLDLIGDTTSPGGSQARAVPGGAAAAYFNPALLTDSPAAATLGFMLFLYIFGQVKTFFDMNKVIQITELPEWSYTLVDGLNNVLPPGIENQVAPAATDARSS